MKCLFLKNKLEDRINKLNQWLTLVRLFHTTLFSFNFSVLFFAHVKNIRLSKFDMVLYSLS